jgi:hypothetical protein
MPDPRPDLTPTRAAGAVAAAALVAAFLLPDAALLRLLAGLPAGAAAALAADPTDRSGAILGGLAGTAAALVAAYVVFAALVLLEGTSLLVVLVSPLAFLTQDPTAFAVLAEAGVTAAAIRYLRYGGADRTAAEPAGADADAAGWTPPETDAGLDPDRDLDLEALVERARSDPDSVVAGYLAAYLSHPRQEQRRGAARALAAVPGEDLAASPETVRALAGALDGELVLRQYVLRALAAAADADPEAVAPGATSPIADSLDDYNVWVRRAAARALSRLARVDPAVGGRVRPMLSAERMGTRAAAAQVLTAAAEHHPETVSAAVPDIQGLLGGGNLDARRAVAALAALAESAPDAIAPAVSDLLSHLDDNRTRADALRALAAVADRNPGALADVGALPRLVDVITDGGDPIGDGDETARDALLAATALLAALEGEEEARATLAPRLAGRDYWTRKRVADALTAAAGPCDEAVLRVLLDDPNRYVRRRAAETILDARGVALK